MLLNTLKTLRLIIQLFDSSHILVELALSDAIDNKPYHKHFVWSCLINKSHKHTKYFRFNVKWVTTYEYTHILPRSYMANRQRDTKIRQVSVNEWLQKYLPRIYWYIRGSSYLLCFETVIRKYTDSAARWLCCSWHTDWCYSIYLFVQLWVGCWDREIAALQIWKRTWNWCCWLVGVVWSE